MPKLAINVRDVALIFQSIFHPDKPPPPHLQYKVVTGITGSPLTPPSYLFKEGLYILLRPPKNLITPSNVKVIRRQTVPKHLEPFVLDASTMVHSRHENFWSLSGPQFNIPCTVQNRYCYPKPTITDKYEASMGGSLWTLYSEDGQEMLDYRLFHVYFSEKRALARQTKCKATKSSCSKTPSLRPLTPQLRNDLNEKTKSKKNYNNDNNDDNEEDDDNNDDEEVIVVGTREPRSSSLATRTVSAAAAAAAAEAAMSDSNHHERFVQYPYVSLHPSTREVASSLNGGRIRSQSEAYGLEQELPGNNSSISLSTSQGAYDIQTYLVEPPNNIPFLGILRKEDHELHGGRIKDAERSEISSSRSLPASKKEKMKQNATVEQQHHFEVTKKRPPPPTPMSFPPRYFEYAIYPPPVQFPQPPPSPTQPPRQLLHPRLSQPRPPPPPPTQRLSQSALPRQQYPQRPFSYTQPSNLPGRRRLEHQSNNVMDHLMEEDYYQNQYRGTSQAYPLIVDADNSSTNPPKKRMRVENVANTKQHDVVLHRLRGDSSNKQKEQDEEFAYKESKQFYKDNIIISMVPTEAAIKQTMRSLLRPTDNGTLHSRLAMLHQCIRECVINAPNKTIKDEMVETLSDWAQQIKDTEYDIVNESQPAKVRSNNVPTKKVATGNDDNDNNNNDKQSGTTVEDAISLSSSGVVEGGGGGGCNVKNSETQDKKGEDENNDDDDTSSLAGDTFLV